MVYERWTLISFLMLGVGCSEKKGTKKILCSWHVDRSWRKAILLHIKDKETQIQVYHHLRILLTERVESQFRVYLQQFLTIIQGTSAEFLQYFRKHYCSKTEQWALCYRAGTQVNTNMFYRVFSPAFKGGLHGAQAESKS